jgi:surface carbohydrate biosynthesis protein
MSKKKAVKKKTVKKRNGKKIVILTASPVRDKLIDELIAQELRNRGHEVVVAPCLRAGRQTCLDIKPDVVVVPPVRNPYSRDFVETLKYHGVGVVSRHTEASCDWQDFKKLDNQSKGELYGHFEYDVDAELVWGPDEAQILSRRPHSPPVAAVGALALDTCTADLVLEQKEVFMERLQLDPKKKTLLIACPWGFADSAPDLNIDETVKARKDIEGRARHITMIKVLQETLSEKWNIVVTLHPGVMPESYTAALPDIPIDTESPSVALLKNCDALIHSGSTMGVEMHTLGKPAFQYQDVNCKLTAGWWLATGSPLSKVSPSFEKPAELAEAVAKSKKGSNADPKAIEDLVLGRYGVMDGKAYKRVADVVDTVEGKWQDKWSRPVRDYNQPMCTKDRGEIVSEGLCGICGGNYTVVKKDWIDNIMKIAGAPENILEKKGLFRVSCPNCCSKFYLPWQR